MESNGNHTMRSYTMRSSLLFALACLTPLAIVFVALPVGPAFAQESADGSLEQQIYAALSDANFELDNIGPETRSAIRAWQRDNWYEETGTLTVEQLGSIRTKASLTATLVTLEPKCADLPRLYLGENHAECWEEVKNQPGCFLWRTHYHSDQTTRWTGSCRSGMAEGRGTYSVSPGSKHASYEGVGMMVNGKANGHWVNTFSGGGRAEGEYRDGVMNGHWVELFSDGGRYEGEMRDGMRNGPGVEILSDGGRYEGEFREGLRNGRGVRTYIYPPATAIEPGQSPYKRYEGEWRDGVKHGFGVAIFFNGVEYEGRWRDGHYHGFGTLTWADGRQYEGHFRESRPHGFGTYWSGGRQFRGQWRDGCFGERNGKWAVINTTKAACGF